MRKFLSLIGGLLLTFPILAQEVCLDVDFTEGIPEDFVLECYDQMPVKSQDFQNLTPEMTWFTSGIINSKDYAAVMSTSHRVIDMETDNWMITPKLTLPAENVFLKWTARSIHYHLRDGYKVMISTTGMEYEDFTELFTVAQEEYLWTKRFVSLQDYAGKDVYIAFVHNSQNKFILAIDDIFVGQPDKVDFAVVDETPRFVGNVGTAVVNGTVFNLGTTKVKKLDCVVNDTDTISSIDTDDVWSLCSGQEYSFEVPVKVGKATHYKLMSGNHVIVADSIICSYYPRTLLLEKATGAWCINCPEVIAYIQELEERFGQQIVCVEAHAHYGDIFEYMPYVTGMKTNSFPTIHFNRDRSNSIYGASAKDKKVLKKLINKPTIAKVEMALDVPVGDSVKASTTVTFGTNVDNATGKYSVGYVLIEKEIQTDLMRQINGSSSYAHHGEFYYIKSPVASDLMWYSNVVRGEKNAFLGIKNSLPSVIEAGKEYVIETNINIPSTVYDKSNLAIVAIVMNYYTDEVLNVAEVKVPVDPSGIRPNVSEDANPDVRISWGGQGRLQISADVETPFTAEVLTIDGRQVSASVSEGSATITLPRRGIYLLRIKQDGRVYTEKVAY
jgi:hypothetical protein